MNLITFENDSDLANDSQHLPYQQQQQQQQQEPNQVEQEERLRREQQAVDHAAETQRLQKKIAQLELDQNDLYALLGEYDERLRKLTTRSVR